MLPHHALIVVPSNHLLDMIAHRVEQVIDSWPKFFLLMDGEDEKDGQIDIEEFAKSTSRLGIALSVEQVEDVVYAFDSDGDGSLDAEEFTSSIMEVAKACHWPVIRDVEAEKRQKQLDKQYASMGLDQESFEAQKIKKKREKQLAFARASDNPQGDSEH